MSTERQEDRLAERGYIRVAEAARMIGRSPEAIYRLAGAGRLRELRVGRARYIERASLIEFLGADAARELGIAAAPAPAAAAS